MPKGHQPTPAELAQLVAQLAKDGHAHWLPAFRNAASANDDNDVYDVWAARPRGRPQRPVADVVSYAAWGKRPVLYHGHCAYHGCQAYLDNRTTLAAACSELIAHLSAHGLTPRKPQPHA